MLEIIQTRNKKWGMSRIYRYVDSFGITMINLKWSHNWHKFELEMHKQVSFYRWNHIILIQNFRALEELETAGRHEDFE
jgi:hypothetical protein